MLPDDPPCGTPAAAQRHRKRGEPVDDACLQAQTEYAREWRHRTGQSRGSWLYIPDENLPAVEGYLKYLGIPIQRNRGNRKGGKKK